VSLVNMGFINDSLQDLRDGNLEQTLKAFLCNKSN
jgi:hypothetical protein